MIEGLDFEVIARSWPYLWKGLQYTVQLTLVGALGGLFFGTLLAMARLSSNPLLSSLAAGYVLSPLARDGETFEIDILGRVCRAEVRARPLWDPDGLRLRA